MVDFVRLRDLNDGRFSVSVGFVLFCYDISKTVGFVPLFFYEISKMVSFVPLQNFNDNQFCSFTKPQWLTV